MKCLECIHIAVCGKHDYEEDRENCIDFLKEIPCKVKEKEMITMNPNRIKTYIFVPEGKYEEEFTVMAYHQLDAIREANKLMSCNTILYMYILGGFEIRHYIATIELNEGKIIILE